MDVVKLVKERYTVKSYNPNKKIKAEDIEKLKEVLQYSASSVNSQPWHFYIISGAAKDKLAEKFPEFNAVKVKNCSHLVVFAQKPYDDNHINKLIEISKPRFGSNEAAFKGYVDYLNSVKGNEAWAGHQVYLSLGSFIVLVAALGIDSSMMEGFDPAIISEALNLKAKHQTPKVVVALGYKSDDDFNDPVRLPKTRFKKEDIITELA